MHPSSVENMKKAIDIIASKLLDKLDILDIGGRNTGITERSYKHLFKDRIKNYYIADINPGHNVTHIMPGEYELPFEDDSIDLVISGQTLEHVRNPFRSVAEMKRVLKPKSYVILIAPSSGVRHDNPDCWRFMDDSFKAIANEVGLIVIADWIDRNAPDQRSRNWQDHIFIGQK